MANDSQSKVRRLFRFRLRTLLALPALFAIGWWYITWPERTAAHFVELLSADQIDAAKAMTDPSDAAGGFWLLATIAQKSDLHFARPKLERSNWKDGASSTRPFKIPWIFGNTHGTLEGFNAHRGQVSVTTGSLPASSSTHRGSKVDPRIMATLLSVAYHNNPQFKFTPIPQARTIQLQLPPALETHVRPIFAILDPEFVPRARYSMIEPSQEQIQPIIDRLREQWQANGEQVITVKTESVAK